MRVTECWPNACESDKSKKFNATESMWFKGASSAVAAQLWAPPKCLQPPLMVIYKKKFFDVMLHLEAEWPLKENILTADTILAEPRPQPGFTVWGGNTSLGGKDLCWYCMFKTNFSEHNKILGYKKGLGVTAPKCPPCLRTWEEPAPESLPLGIFVFVQGR